MLKSFFNLLSDSDPENERILGLPFNAVSVGTTGSLMGGTTVRGPERVL
jgi:hypothetical protein